VSRLQKEIQPGITRWHAIGLTMFGVAAMWYFLPIDLSIRPAPAAAQTEQSKIPGSEFERRIRAYLLKHPEVIVEAMQIYQDQQRADEVKVARQLLKSRAKEILHDPASPVSGNAKGDVTVVEFFDYNCPYCRRVVPDMIKLEEDDPKLRIVYKEFPILGPNSTFAAKAALAADRQGKYLEFHRALMKSRSTVNEKSVLRTAVGLGLNIEQLKKDIAAPEIAAALERNIALAGALRINGTPAFVIGQEIVPGAMGLKAMQELVRKARGGK